MHISSGISNYILLPNLDRLIEVRGAPVNKDRHSRPERSALFMWVPWGQFDGMQLAFVSKFIYFEKAIKFWEIVDLTVTTQDNQRWWFHKNFVSFSQNLNFNSNQGPAQKRRLKTDCTQEHDCYFITPLAVHHKEKPLCAEYWSKIFGKSNT